MLHLTIGIMGAHRASLPGEAGDFFEGTSPLSKGFDELEEGDLALAADYYIHVFFGERLVGQEAWMPSTEDDGQARYTGDFAAFGDFDSAEDRGTGEEQRCRGKARRPAR